MSISELDKNAWVMPFLCFLVPVREKLKNTVVLDHPVGDAIASKNKMNIS